MPDLGAQLQGQILPYTTGGPYNPVGTTSTSFVMMGLAKTYTPVRSGILLIIVTGRLQNSKNPFSADVQIQVGTGTPPSNGAAQTGTQVGQFVTTTLLPDGGTAPFSISGVAVAAVGVATWIDVALLTTSATGQATSNNIGITVVEL